MPCIAVPGQFYRDPRSGQLFEVTHAMVQIIRVMDVRAGEPRMLNRMIFEADCEQVSA